MTVASKIFTLVSSVFLFLIFIPRPVFAQAVTASCSVSASLNASGQIQATVSGYSPTSPTARIAWNLIQGDLNSIGVDFDSTAGNVFSHTFENPQLLPNTTYTVLVGFYNTATAGFNNNGPWKVWPACYSTLTTPPTPPPPPPPTTPPEEERVLLYNNAQCLGYSVPLSVEIGRSVPVSVTLKNTGNRPWDPNAVDGYRLGSQSPQDNTRWTATPRVALPNVVNPGGQVTLNFNITPNVTGPGSYPFQWRMVEENIQWFGEFCPVTALQISVTSTATADLRINNTPSAYSAFLPTSINVNSGSPVYLVWQTANINSASGGSCYGSWDPSQTLSVGDRNGSPPYAQVTINNVSSSQTYIIYCKQTSTSPTVQSSVFAVVNNAPPIGNAPGNFSITSASTGCSGSLADETLVWSQSANVNPIPGISTGDRYDVYNSLISSLPSSGLFSRIGSVTGGLSFYQSGLPNSTTVYYYIKAINSFGTTNSPVSTVVTQNCAPTTTGPVNLLGPTIPSGIIISPVDPFCGDATCTTGETCSSCSGDCCPNASCQVSSVTPAAVTMRNNEAKTTTAQINWVDWPGTPITPFVSPIAGILVPPVFSFTPASVGTNSVGSANTTLTINGNGATPGTYLVQVNAGGAKACTANQFNLTVRNPVAQPYIETKDGDVHTNTRLNAP